MYKKFLSLSIYTFPLFVLAIGKRGNLLAFIATMLVDAQ
jgi:hypothetical protein